MPGLSGFELIEKVREISPDIKIMIISGYANFEYAQNALKQGVSDYLLKPINKEALNESLAKMVTEIENNRKMILYFRIFRMSGEKNLSNSEICLFMTWSMTDI